MLFQILAKFEIQRYYKNEPKSSSVYSRNNLPKKKYGGYEINAEECKSIGTYRYVCIMIVSGWFCMWIVIMWHFLIILEFSTL